MLHFLEKEVIQFFCFQMTTVINHLALIITGLIPSGFHVKQTNFRLTLFRQDNIFFHAT